jgi:hypothetical protein
MAYDAKSTINKSIFIGRLGQKPESSYTSGFCKICAFDLAMMATISLVLVLRKRTPFIKAEVYR